jgi:hypothetical protein
LGIELLRLTFSVVVAGGRGAELPSPADTNGIGVEGGADVGVGVGVGVDADVGRFDVERAGDDAVVVIVCGVVAVGVDINEALPPAEVSFPC